MKKIFNKFVLAAFVAASVALSGRAEDSYLYWTFDNYNTGYSFDGARIGVVTEGQDTTYLTGFWNEGIQEGNGRSFLEMYTQISTVKTGSSFLLELLNGSEVSYVSDLVNWQSAAVVNQSMATPNLTPTSFAVGVPEPTSGMLFLLGVAALALRRRKGEVATVEG